MVTVQDLQYMFPPPPSPDAVEWPGVPIGKSNVVTRTKSRTLYHDKNVDETPGKREHLVNAAIAYVVENGGREPIYLHDAVIHGIRVRAITNSDHLIQFWRENWYSPEEWRRATGLEPPAEPRVVVYALGRVPGEPEAAYYSRATNTIVFFNTSYYGQLKSWVLGAVGRVLAAEYGIHSIHGACVEIDDRGVLYIAPTGTGKSTSSYGLMGFPNTKFHSDDWVYVRYARRTKGDRILLPIEIRVGGETVARGYRCNGWIAAHPNAEGMARCLDLTNAEVTLPLSDFDVSRPLEAYAYTSEKVFYLRSNLVENFPDTADTILRSNLENVPSATPSFLRDNAPTVDSIVESIRNSANPRVRAAFGAMPPGVARELVAALFAFDNARAMLDIADVFPPERVFTNPMEPVRLTTVFLLKRDPADPVILKVLPLDRFMERLLIGQTPEVKREIAYNAYRAVNDEREGRLVEQIEAQSRRSGRALYEEFLRARDVPESLAEEFELFRQMYESTLDYDLNTILQRDPMVASKKEAVERTLTVILRGIENRDRDFTLTLTDYRSRLEMSPPE
jgi:hypothetical protein